MGGQDDLGRGGDEPQPLLSRRRVVAGGAMAIGGLAAMGQGTGALFGDSNPASGTVQIDAPFQLNYVITDNTDNVSGNKASYTINYQVEWLAGFSSLDLTVENLDDGTTPFTGSSTSAEDSFSFQENNGNGKEYRFTFTTFENGTQYDQQSVTDVAGGSGVSQGDLGSVDSPTLDNFTVTDTSTKNKAAFDVDYLVTNTTDFDRVVVTFTNLDSNNKNGSGQNTAADGVVSYGPEGGTGGDEYEITVDVYNTSNVVTDSGTVTIVADGTTDASWP